VGRRFHRKTASLASHFRLSEAVWRGSCRGVNASVTSALGASKDSLSEYLYTSYENDYQLILPLLAAVILSLFVAERLHRDSIYTLKLARRGIHLKQGRDLDVMGTVRVEEVMVRVPVTVPAALPVTSLSGEFLRTGRHGFPVLNEDGSLLGVVSLEDYRRAVANGRPAPEQLTVRDIATLDVVSVYPEDTVDVALLRMPPCDLSRLPVVACDNPRRLVGVVRRNDIVRAYEVGVVRREEARQRAEASLNTCDTCVVRTGAHPTSPAW